MSAPALVLPAGVPTGALRIEDGERFDEIEQLHRDRDGRAYLRVAFPFAWSWCSGLMLRSVGPRMLCVHRRTWSMGRAMVFSCDGPLPPVWVWTLAQERAARRATDPPA